MTNVRKMYLPVSLQFFGEDTDDQTIEGAQETSEQVENNEQVEQVDEPELSGEDMIRQLFEQAQEEEDIDEQPEEEQAEQSDGNDEQQPPEVEEDKPVQTPEENARFAEMRRQQQAAERAQREFEQQLQQRPEYQMAKMLEEMYGMPADQLMEQLKQAQLEKEAQEKGVPVEYLRQIQDMQMQQQELQNQLERMKFDNWYKRMEQESQQLLEEYKMLNYDDINAAMSFSLQRFGISDMPLSQAVFALHGDKIVSELKKQARQEALAEQSGRKRSALPPQGVTKQGVQPILTEDERRVAKMMGMTEEDYLKWKVEDE
jgi:hypothetical protein